MQLQETEEDTQEEQEENQYFDTVDDMGDGEYVRKENEEVLEVYLPKGFCRVLVHAHSLILLH